MKFSQLFKNAKDYDQFEYNDTKIMKVPSENLCVYCQKDTSEFVDVQFQIPLCSEECDKAVWIEYENGMKDDFLRNHMARYKDEMRQELVYVEGVNDVMKDIVIVVHDQLDYLKITIDSVLEYTNNFHLWIWDNNSNEETKTYLQNLMFKLNDDPTRCCTVMSSDVNMGFIEPNNELAALGSGDYIILLNSDVKVFGGWDKAMLGWLQQNQDTKIVGYAGGLLDDNGVGGRLAFGYEIDYVSGWCLCVERKTYNKYGLFNSDLKFAYAEDSEMSIRLQSSGHRIYALHLLLVHHYENKTINQVRKEGAIDVVSTFAHNHEKLRQLWPNYLSQQRVDVRVRVKGEEALDEILGKLG
jgi:GT2 family glycosyltransferase